MITGIEGKYRTIYADPPWRFMGGIGSPEASNTFRDHRKKYQNKTNTNPTEHYKTLLIADIKRLNVPDFSDINCHLYLWACNGILDKAIDVMRQWGFTYKSNIVWHKLNKKDGKSLVGLGNYFRNSTEVLLFGVKGKGLTLERGRRQVNIVHSTKREHSRKPDEFYEIIEGCSPGPYLELFARTTRPGWTAWGNQTDKF